MTLSGREAGFTVPKGLRNSSNIVQGFTAEYRSPTLCKLKETPKITIVMVSWIYDGKCKKISNKGKG